MVKGTANKRINIEAATSLGTFMDKSFFVIRECGDIMTTDALTNKP